jgi:hypothetical protein
VNEASVEDALLVVAFGAAPAARAAWASVAGRIDIEQLPFELHGLFPSVGVALRRLGLEPAELPRFDGVRKRLWALNVVRARALCGLLDTLATGGVESYVTGGMAVLLHHGDLGTRPLTEVDVVIDPDSEPRAVGLAQAAGWEVVEVRRDGFLMDQRATVISKAGQLLTLRSRARPGSATLTMSPGGGPQQLLVPAVGERPIPVATPTETLGFALIEGPGLPGYFAVRRRLDALLLTSMPDQTIDWDSFVAMVRDRHAEPEVLAELRRLSVSDDPIPGHVTRAFDTSRVPLYERLSRPVIGLSPVALGCLRRHRGSGGLRAMAALPRDLAQAWDLPNARAVFPALLHRVGGRLKRRPARGSGS